MQDYDIEPNKDIIGVITDGASVMEKFGNLITHFHLMCQAHGLHLAVGKYYIKQKL